jgi:hypothetical protein
MKKIARRTTRSGLPTLTKTEITRALRKYRYDPDYEMPDVLGHRAANHAKKDRRTGRPHRALGRLGERVIPVQCIANLARLHVSVVEDARLGVMTETVRAALSHVIEGIESGRVRFVRNRERHGPRWSVEYHDPPARPPQPQDKLTRAGDWVEWARCRNCGGQGWRSVVIAGAFWYACRDCIGPDSLPAMGARETNVAEKLALPESQMRQDFQQL